jgi:hypothetical protein
MVCWWLEYQEGRMVSAYASNIKDAKIVQDSKASV